MSVYRTATSNISGLSGNNNQKISLIVPYLQASMFYILLFLMLFVCLFLFEIF